MRKTSFEGAHAVSGTDQRATGKVSALLATQQVLSCLGHRSSVRILRKSWSTLCPASAVTAPRIQRRYFTPGLRKGPMGWPAVLASLRPYPSSGQQGFGPPWDPQSWRVAGPGNSPWIPRVQVVGPQASFCMPYMQS